MLRYLNPLMVAIVGLVVLGLGVAYASGRLELGTFAFLGCVAVALGVVVLIFLGRMLNPEESLEQTLYKDQHPTERR